MASFNQIFFSFFSTLIFISLFLLKYSTAAFPSPPPPLSGEVEPKGSLSKAAVEYYQVLYIKNTPPYFLGNEGALHNNVGTKKKRRKMVNNKRRKKTIKNSNTKPFSVMLPKGYVPPSGSSPCHNDKPNSKDNFFCAFSADTAAKP